MTFGEQLASLRRQHNHTQEQLAELLGVSRQSVSRWESDLTYPETEKLLRIAKLYGCSLDELFGRSAETPAHAEAPAPAELLANNALPAPRVGRGCRIAAAVCFWLILAGEILRTVAAAEQYSLPLLILRMTLLSAVSLLLVPWLIRGGRAVAVAACAVLLALSVTQLVWGFFTDCYLLEYEVERSYAMGEMQFVHTETRTRFVWSYVLPYLLEAATCGMLTAQSLWMLTPRGQRLSRRLWMLPVACESVALLLGVMMESALRHGEEWAGGIRYYNEISLAEGVLFAVFLLLACLGAAKRAAAAARAED